MSVDRDSLERWNRDYYGSSLEQAARMANKWTPQWRFRFATYTDVVQRLAGEQGWVLDLGCGGGQTTYAIASGVRQVLGLDISCLALRGRPPQPDNVSFVQADAASLPFASRCFDVVAFHDALEHLPAVERALQQALRVVRPDGWLVVFSPNLISPLRSWSLLAQGARSGKWHPDASPCFWLRSLWLNALKVTGLQREFTYRQPLVRDLSWPGPDYDAIYLVNPLDLLHFSRQHDLYVQHMAEGTSRVGKLVARWWPWFAGGIAFVAQKPAHLGRSCQAQGETA